MEFSTGDQILFHSINKFRIRFLSSGKELLVLGLSVSWSVGRSVSPSVRTSKKMSKKFLQLENDLSEQILENESYSGS